MHQRALQLDGYGYEVVAIYANRNEASDPSTPAVVRLEKLEQIPEFVITQHIQEVWITLSLSSSASLLDLQFLLRNALVDIRWVPDTVGLQMLSSHMVDFLGLPTVDLNRPICGSV
jgi:putative colanic acid biosynthesis UDP-glucose lipid carrier transferase